MIRISIIFTASIFLLLSSYASADVDVCNRISVPVLVGKTFSKGFYFSGNDATAKWWFRIESGKCRSFHIEGESDDFYARSLDNRYTWSGSDYYDCMGHSMASGEVTWKQDHSSNAILPCPVGSKRVQTTRLANGSSWYLERGNSEFHGPARKDEEQILEKEVKDLEYKLQLLEEEEKHCDAELIASIDGKDPAVVDINILRQLNQCNEYFGRLADEIESMRKKISHLLCEEGDFLDNEIISPTKHQLDRRHVFPPFAERWSELNIDHLLFSQTIGSIEPNSFQNLVHDYQGIIRDYQGSHQTIPQLLMHAAFAATFKSFENHFRKVGYSSFLIPSTYLIYAKRMRNFVTQHSKITDIDQYGFLEKSPVPVKIRKTVSKGRELASFNQIKVSTLRKNLQKWSSPELNQSQKRVLKTIEALGKLLKEAFVGVSDFHSYLNSILSNLIDSSKKESLCLGQVLAAGDAGDLYEFTSGFDQCTGESLTTTGRVISGVGLFLGSGKFFRKALDVLGVTTTVSSKLQKICDSAKDIGLDLKKGVDRYGDAAIGSISDDGAKAALKGWGTSKSGFNQLFEHSVKYSKDLPTRLPSIEQRAGLPSGSLSKVGSNTSSEVAQGLRNVDDLANRVMKKGASKSDGLRTQHWVSGVDNPKKGIRVVVYDGKKQSIGPMAKKDWDKQ